MHTQEEGGLKPEKTNHMHGKLTDKCVASGSLQQSDWTNVSFAFSCYSQQSLGLGGGAIRYVRAKGQKSVHFDGSLYAEGESSRPNAKQSTTQWLQ